MKQRKDGVDRPRTIGPYRLEESLGSGGMGTVWRAWDERLKRRVAVKQIRADAIVSNARERLRREAQATARLNHPAIVQIYDILEREDGDWIVMEFVAGRTLRGLLDEKGALGPVEVVKLGREIAEGLAEAHGYGILHRDLKASNIMMMPSGRAKILDFGIAKELAPEGEAATGLTLSVPGTVVGTCYAMAPEQVLGHPLDARADLFSLGSLLYETLTGESPFRAESPTVSLARVLSFQPKPLQEVRPDVPRAFSDLVDRLLEKNPEHRPQSASEVLEALAGVTAAAADGRPSPAAERPARESQEVTLLTLTSQPGTAPSSRGRRAGRTAAATGRRRRRGEHRPVTVVCCGLVSLDMTTGETSSLDLEILSEAMTALQDLARDVCSRHSGELGAALGNLVWLYFGYPQAHEDDAVRAVRAAREIAVRTDELGLRFGPLGRQELALRIAVHTGPAMVAARPDQEQWLQLGVTLEFATGLQSGASVRDLVVSAQCHQLIVRGFVTEALPAVRVPGFEQPVARYRVLEAVDALQKESGELGPFVGRARELEILLDRFRLTRTGIGQVVMISGEAGIGKSRLVRALRERLGGEAPDWLVAYGSPHTQSSPLAPIVDLLERTVFASAESAHQRDVARLEEFLALHGAAVPESVPPLASLLSLPLDEGFSPLDQIPDALRQRTFQTLVALFAEMAERSPLILVLEDLHWIDPSTLELVQRLLDEIAAFPLLLIVTFRPEFEAPWGYRSQVTQLRLNRLTDSEAVALIDRLSEDRALPPGVQQQILVRTDGVPLFVEELTKAILETSPEGGQAEIPSTLHGSLAARLDRLGPGKEVAQIAAVIGRDFSFELLAALSPLGDTSLQGGLEELIKAELLHRRGIGRRARYSFKHSLIQDAAYASLLGRDRRELHRKIADTLEEELTRSGRSLLEDAVHRGEALRLLLAHHWSQALDLRQPDPVSIKRAVNHLVAAGEQTLRLSAYKEAHAHLGIALGLVQALPQGAEQDEQELILQTRLGTVFKAIRGWASPQVKESYDRAWELCLRLGNRRELPSILFGLWQYHLFHVEYERSLGLAEECLEQARETDVLDRLMAHCALSNSLFWLGRLLASLGHAEQVLKLAAPQHHGAYSVRYGQDPRIHAAQFSVFCLWHLGEAEAALARHDASLRVAEQDSHPFSLAIALVTSVTLHRDRHDIVAVRQAAEKLIDLSRELGFLPYERVGETFRNWALAAAGRAADVAEETIRLVDAPGKPGLALRCCLLVTVCQRAGRLEDAFAALQRGLDTVRENEEVAYEAELHCLRAELLLQQSAAAGGEGPAGSFTSAAEAALRQAFALACQRLQVPVAERAGLLLAGLLTDRGQAAEAASFRDRAQELRIEASAKARRILEEIGAEIAS